MAADGFRRVRAFLLALTLLVALWGTGAAAAPEKQTVRVGYIKMQGFLYDEADGSYSGLAYDLLREIGSYNNWAYEFTECGYAEVETLFAQGRLDLFVPYQKTPDREQVYEYSSEVFCTNKASLLTLADSPIGYGDFSALDGCVIGVLKGTRNGERFREYLLEQGCTVTVKTDYIRREEMLEAIQRGEIDAFVSASNRGITDFKIVAQLPQTSSYAIAPKGDRTFLDPLDDALNRINLEMPTLIHALEQKALNATEGRYPSLSTEERDYIAQKQQVTVLISPEECDAEGNFSSSAKTLLGSISELTGLTFVPVIPGGTTAIMEGITAGQADIIYTFNRDFDWAEQHNVWVTCSYSDFYNQVITKAGRTDVKTVAVVPGSYIAYWVAQNTGYTPVPCLSYAACIDAVLAGRADATYCNSPIGNYYSTFPKYSSLSFLTAFDMESSYCLGVSQSSDQILVDILNKAILCIPPSMLSQVYEVQMNSRPVYITDIFYANPVLCLSLMAVALVIVLTLVFIVFYLRHIKKKNIQLAVANSAKTDFMSRMSHDMRTPMNGILGLVQLTRTEPDPAAVKANLDQIELSGRVLLNLINDTLDMNKLEGGKLELRPRPINSEEVFGNVLANAQIMAKSKGVELKLTAPDIGHGKWVPVLADASRLEQILLNIISNAVKFTPAGGTVELIMRTLSVGEGVVRDEYIIRDSGIGMSAEFLPHLFDAFSQESRGQGLRDNKDQGTGLGMSIVKQLVTLMDGEIQVESEPGRGTTVTLHMHYPICDKAALPRDEEAPVDVAELRGRRGLLCEDHPINAQIAVKLLARAGVEMDVAENGRLGLEKFSASPAGTYAFILMDIRMPEMDGLEATRAIRALDRPDAGTIPVIAMTANAFDEDVQNCLDAGMDDHLAKPFEAEKLYRTIAKHLGCETRRKGHNR